MNWTVETLLTVHIAAVAMLLTVAALFLLRHGLLRWTSAGFWALGSFVLYYVLNPLFALRDTDLYLYRVNLMVAGGTERGLWILVVVLAGISAFFTAYLCTSSGVVTWNLQKDSQSLTMSVCAMLFAGIGVYSLLVQRAQVFSSGREMTIEGGRFTGLVTGYENAGYMFMIVPILLLVLSGSRVLRVCGWLATGLFIFLALPNSSSRFALVSILIAVSLADTIRREVFWPQWFYAPILLVFTLILQLRGHVDWKLETGLSQLFELSNTATQSLFTTISSAVGSKEVSALATWYLESYVVDHLVGYNYGLPVINYVLTGWIPSRFFPQKYFLVDWLASQRIITFPSIEQQLFGAKSTLMGSFYSIGGLIGVILLAALAGYLSRKLDGMLTQYSPLLVRATGIAWMSVLWMLWQSSDTWSVMVLGILALPALAMWVLAPKDHQSIEIEIVAAIKDREWKENGYQG